MNNNKRVKSVTHQLSADLDGIIKHIKPAASWKDWVYSQKTLTKLKNICRDFTPGKSLACLFTGKNISGKTLAAKIIAKKIRKELYRIDLSRVVGKYIGETEKNLKQLFDHAENHEWVLFFDEADALFGKRDEEDDTQDHSGIKGISFLFKRIEEYEGVSILATSKHMFDAASLRRFRFVVDFPVDIHPEDK
jgi:SpoVK/Ycf46/Vps4 family AAA+-type ATPase